jgi:hypothetical protein
VKESVGLKTCTRKWEKNDNMQRRQGITGQRIEEIWSICVTGQNGQKNDARMRNKAPDHTF